MAKTSELRQGRPAVDITGAPSIEPFFEVGNRLFETWAAIGAEILEFSKTQLDQGLEVSRTMAKSGSVSEAMDVQARFTRSLMQDYISEANKLADMSTRSFLDSFATMQKQPKSGTSSTDAAE
jgi:hypothetical protein